MRYAYAFVVQKCEAVGWVPAVVRWLASGALARAFLIGRLKTAWGTYRKPVTTVLWRNSKHLGAGAHGWGVVPGPSQIKLLGVSEQPLPSMLPSRAPYDSGCLCVGVLWLLPCVVEKLH